MVHAVGSYRQARTGLTLLALGEAVVDPGGIAGIVPGVVARGAPRADVVGDTVAVLVDAIRVTVVRADLHRRGTHGPIGVVAVAHGDRVAVTVGVEVLVRDAVAVVVDSIVGLELRRVHVCVLVVAVQRGRLVDLAALGDVGQVAVAVVVVRLGVVDEVVAVVVPRVADLGSIGVDELVAVVAVPLLHGLVAGLTLTQGVVVVVQVAVGIFGAQTLRRDLDAADLVVQATRGQSESAADREQYGEDRPQEGPGQVGQGDQLHERLQQADGLGFRNRNCTPFRERMGIGPITRKESEWSNMTPNYI